MGPHVAAEMSESTTTKPDEPHQRGHLHSTLKEFPAAIHATSSRPTTGRDLPNGTAPPFVLDTRSAVELPACWAERPSLFAAPASSPDPAERALRVLRWFLASLRSQQHDGGRGPGEEEEEEEEDDDDDDDDDGVRRPLDAFLGECFLARWEEEDDDDDDRAGGGDGGGGGTTTTLVAEQVSHRPPVTAWRLWDEARGVVAEGCLARRDMTPSLGSIAIRQAGHALLTLRGHGDEAYLVPVPDVGLDGSYTIPCTSGYYSVVEFGGGGGTGTGTGTGTGARNEFVARLHAPGRPEDALYTVAGRWDEAFTIHKGGDASGAAATETIVLEDLPTVPPRLLEPNLDAQDPWESRRAWRGVRDALRRGDKSGAARAKSAIEQGQRDMRRDEAASGRTWTSLFFKPHREDAVAAGLYKSILKELNPKDTVAIWKFDEDRWKEGPKRPFHGVLTPDNKNKNVIVVDDNNNNNNNNNEEKKPAVAAPRNQHLEVVIRGDGGPRDSDDDLSSPASFKTAHEYFLAAGAPVPVTNVGPPATKGGPPVTNGGPPAPQPAAAGTGIASGRAPRTRPVTPPAAAARRRSVVDAPPGGKAASPSSASTSPSPRRGRRQRARESIGRFRSSLSSGFSKIGGRANGEENL